MTTGEKIKNARQALGYTQEQLAEKLLVSRQAIAKWENDRGVPDIENLKAISTFFNISVDSLLASDEEKNGFADSMPECEQPFEGEPYASLDSLEPIKKSGKKHVKIIIVAAALLVILAILLIIIISPNFQGESNTKDPRDVTYEQAVQLYEQGDYAGAIAKIATLNYKDSQDLHNSWRYEFAHVLTQDKNYNEAAALFLELGEYKDSAQKWSDLHYPRAVQFYNNKDFDSAAYYFDLSLQNSKLNYDEVVDCYKRARYREGCDLYNEGKYGDAYNVFNSMVKRGYSEYQRIGEKTKVLLTDLLLAGLMWTGTETVKSDNGSVEAYVTFAFSDKTTTWLLNNVQNAETISSKQYTTGAMLPTDDLRGVGIQEVFIGSAYNSPIVFTFSFSGNYVVNIHYNDFAGSCSEPICGTYKSLPASVGDYSTYDVVFKDVKSMNYSFSKMPEPPVLFESDLPENSGTANGTDSSAPNNSELGQDNITQPNDSSNNSSAENTIPNTQEQKPSGNQQSNTNNNQQSNTNNNQQQNQSNNQQQNPSNNQQSNTNNNQQQNPSNNQQSNTNNNQQQNPSNTPESDEETDKDSTVITPVDPCAGGHAWVETKKTIHHDEVGHYESQKKSKRVTVYKCAVCYSKFKTLNEYYVHFDSAHASSGGAIKFLREQYETTEDWEYYYEDVWVVDKKAYDEVVVVSRKCSRCNKTEQF